MKRTGKLFRTAVVLSGIMFTAVIACNNQPAANDAEEESATEEMTAASEPRSPIAQGEELYISYCAICHGKEGKGDGSMAEMLTAIPANLTTIAMRRDGTYPNEEIYKIIDGQIELAGHGTSEMPIWGATFRESEQLESREEVEQRINSLVAYLETIQAEE